MTDILDSLKEPMQTRTKRDMFLNNIIDPNYETTKTILKSSKSLATFDKCARDIQAREDNLECITNRERKSAKIQPLSRIRRARAISNPEEEQNLKKYRIAIPLCIA